MFCLKCGKENGEGAMFCQGCGTQLSEGSPQQPQPQYYAPPQQQLQQPIQQQPYYPSPPTKKPKKPLYKRVWFWLIVVFIGIPVLSGIVGGGNDSEPTAATATASNSASMSKKEESSIKPEPVFNENEYSEDIPISDLIRNADEFKDAKVKYRGTISQKMGPTSGITIYRIAINGNSDYMVYVNETKGAMVDTVIDGDMVDFYGIVKGQTSYQSVLGATVYLPEIDMQKLVKVDTASLIEYIDNPFTVTEYSYDGSISQTTEIDSVNIKAISMSYSGDMSIEMEIVGTVTGYEYMSLNIKCYDVDGISLGEKSIFASVTDSEKFRINESVYVPAETTRIEFVHD